MGHPSGFAGPLSWSFGVSFTVRHPPREESERLRHWGGSLENPLTCPLFARGASCRNDRPSLLGFGTSPIAFTPHCLLTTPSSFDHGRRVSATKGPGGCHLGVERGHRNRESREGTLKYYPGQGRF